MKKHLALVIGLLAQLPVGAGVINDSQTTTSVPASVHEKTKEDLPNFHQVHPFLFRGGEPTRQGLQQLKKMGIGTIIDLRAGQAVVEEARQAKELGLTDINLPMSSKAPTPQQVKTFLQTVEQAEKTGSPVFVHCAHGSDRTGCMVGLWRVTHDGYNYEQAYAEMRKYYFTPKFTNLSGTVAEYAQLEPKSKDNPL